MFMWLLLLIFCLHTFNPHHSSYDRDAQYDFLRPCLQELGDDDDNDDVSLVSSRLSTRTHAYCVSFSLLTVFMQDAFEEEVADAVSEDDSWHSDNDDSDDEKPPAVVAKRPSKVAAGKKTAANKMPPACANASTHPSVAQTRLPAAGGSAVSMQGGDLVAPASLHMPAVPFETVDDVHFDGVDEDYGDD
jgi:hypothetical protein